MKNLIYAAVLLLSTCYGINAQDIQRVRIDLETPLGQTRQLLLGFTPDNSATDGFDYGYDAPNIDNFPDDFSWIIDNEPYIIQGVGAFQASKKYPIGFFLSNTGNVTIDLNSLENFQGPIDVFIYDAYENAYTLINDQSFTANLSSGIYTDRYYIAFDDLNSNQNLSLNEVLTAKGISLQFNRSTRNLEIRLNQAFLVESLEIYNQLGQRLVTRSIHETNDRFSLVIGL